MIVNDIMPDCESNQDSDKARSFIYHLKGVLDNYAMSEGMTCMKITEKDTIVSILKAMTKRYENGTYTDEDITLKERQENIDKIILNK